MLKIHRARALGCASALAIACAWTATAAADMAFNRIATFEVAANLSEGVEGETAAEIVAASEDGLTLLYTDSPMGALGFIDIADPAAPAAGGVITLDGEPTSVAVAGGSAFVGVNTSESYVEPSGHLVAIDIASREEVGRCDLGGQPDSVAAAKDGAFVVVAIENERDEDLNDGVIPQLPAGNVVIAPLTDGALACDALITVDLTGLAEVAPEDPEPEYVDVNALGEIVVTLQENNHLVVLSAAGDVLNHFSAGAADLEGIDVDEEMAFRFDSAKMGVVREPDAVSWVDDQLFATADEGDYEGGSRGWTIFDKESGEIVYDDALGLEQRLIQMGHYPERRSGNKGVEPEGVETGVFGDETLVFVGAERAGGIGVYSVENGEPLLTQVLPAGIGPEGILALPARDLFVVANEVDLREDGGPGSTVMIYQRAEGEAVYPTITAEGADALIGWTALSGLAADPEEAGKLYAVNDSFMRSQPRIYTIDASASPARITGFVDVTRDGASAQKLDLEGVAPDGEGGFWLASEGRADRLIPHALYRVDADGAIVDEVAFPAELLNAQRRFGAEGVARVGDRLWIAIQREWEDDAKGEVKLVSYDIESEAWGYVRYPLDKGERGWVGLSEITIANDTAYILERDNQIGPNAAIKRLYAVELATMQPAALGEDAPLVEKTLVRDLLADLQSFNGVVLDKVESLAIDATGEVFLMTDNDGVDDHSGETIFWSIGQL